MSVVPYNQQNKLVYHDPHTQIAIVHDRHAQTVRLLDSLPQVYPNTSDHATCPRCGYDLGGFFEPKPSSGFRDAHFQPEFQPEVPGFVGDRPLWRRGSDYGIPGSSLAPDSEYWGTLGGTHFMHRDYFKLLSGLSADLRLEYPNNSAGTLSAGDMPPPELFNQGYFGRFFQKIPPYVLGSGAHAYVYKVQHVLKNTSLGVFAVKRINVGNHSRYLDRVLNEVLILYELSANGSAANLIRYNHVWMEMGDLHDSSAFIVPPQNTLSEPVQIPYVYILQQYCAGGNLESMITQHFLQEEHLSVRERVERERRRRRGSKPESVAPSTRWLSDVETWKFFTDIATAVHYLHSHQILHRDLKPPNCLLETAYVPQEPRDLFPDVSVLEDYLASLPKVLVSDFGEGKFLDKSKKPELRMGNTGTVEFADPKLWVYDSVKHYTHTFTYSCDIYSLGLIMCYLCVGSSPFSADIRGLDDPEMVRRVISAWYETLEETSFLEWWGSESARVRGQCTDCTHAMGVLAYAMITGEADSKAVLVELQHIKSKFVKSAEPPKTKSLPSVHRVSVALLLLNLSFLELLDTYKASYVWKVLKLAHVAALFYGVGLGISTAFLVVILACVIKLEAF